MKFILFNSLILFLLKLIDDIIMIPIYYMINFIVKSDLVLSFPKFNFYIFWYYLIWHIVVGVPWVIIFYFICYLSRIKKPIFAKILLISIFVNTLEIVFHLNTNNYFKTQMKEYYFYISVGYFFSSLVFSVLYTFMWKELFKRPSVLS